MNLDEWTKWANITLAKLIYGSDVKVSVSADWGTEFYLETIDDIQARFDKAKKSGMPESEIDAIYKLLIETKYKGNKEKIQRALILKELNPLPYDNWNVVKEKRDSGVINDEDFALIARFTNFIDRFEREQAPIVEFGKDLEFDARIKSIREILNTYINEQTSSTEPSGTGDEGNE